MNACQRCNRFERARFNFWSLQYAGDPHETRDKTTDSELNGCACHGIWECFKHLFVIAAEEI